MIEVRKCRVSADWKYPKKGVTPTRLGTPGRYLTYWRVVVDGRLIDSFVDKGQAEKKAAALRRAETSA